MNNKWTYKTFGEVGTFLRGKSIQKADFVEKGLPCIHYGQIHTKFGISIDKHLSEIPLEVYNKSIIASPGDVIIAITSEDLDGSCKSTAWLGDYDVAVSAHAAVYKHNLNPKFIAYYLRSNSFYIEKEKYARGFKVMEIKPTDIARIPIPVPSSDVQKSVVSELDKINELITQKKSQLNDFDSLTESYFFELFGDPFVNDKGWEVKKLGDITDPTIGLTYKPENVTSDGSGTVVLRSSNIQQSKLSFEDIVRVNVSIKEEKYVKNGDILMCSRNGSFKLVGKVAMIQHLSEPMSYGAFMTIIRSEYNPYLFGYFKTPAFRDYLIKGKTTTVNQITVKMLKDIKLPIPPHTLIQSFAERISNIERQKQQISSSINDLETLLASRMQYWFD